MSVTTKVGALAATVTRATAPAWCVSVHASQATAAV
jgi:hypothetical protein